MAITEIRKDYKIVLTFTEKEIKILYNAIVQLLTQNESNDEDYLMDLLTDIEDAEYNIKQNKMNHIMF